MALHLIRTCKNAVHKFATGYYNSLLIFLTALIVLRPTTANAHYIIAWKLLFVITLMSAVFSAKSSRTVKWITAALLVPIIIIGRISVSVDSLVLLVSNSIFTVLFISITAIAILYDVILGTRVTLETFKGAVSAFLMCGLAFAYIFYLIEILSPGSFFFAPGELLNSSHPAYLSKMIYFSFMALLAIGYGDILPLHDFAQTVVIIEGTLGQFYVAILISRLVSVYTFSGDRELLREYSKQKKNQQA